MNFSKVNDRSTYHYHKYLGIGDFHTGTSENALRNFRDLYKLKNLVRDPIYF